MNCICKSCKCNNGESHSIPLQLQLQLTAFDEKTDMTDKQPDLWFSFVRAHRAIIKKIETQLSEAGLPAYAWYDVLWGLESGENGTRRMHELADVLVIERYNLTRLMDRLEKERLVTRFRSDDDRRASFATITEEGKALRKKNVGDLPRGGQNPLSQSVQRRRDRTLLRRVGQRDAAGQSVIRHRA